MKRAYSWEHEDGLVVMCKYCSEKYLPESTTCWTYRINRLCLNNNTLKLPEGYYGFWTGQAQEDCIQFGSLPKCDLCSKYMFNYKDICIKSLNTKKCTCRNCAPNRYTGDYLLQCL